MSNHPPTYPNARYAAKLSRGRRNTLVLRKLLITSGAIATAKSMGPKFQSEEEELEDRVIFPPATVDFGPI